LSGKRRRRRRREKMMGLVNHQNILLVFLFQTTLRGVVSL
jgi:hypothetical protein